MTEPTNNRSAHGRRPDAHGRARRRKEAHGFACLRALSKGPLVASQMTPDGRLWCLHSGLATRLGSTWTITEKGRELLRRRQALIAGRAVHVALAAVAIFGLGSVGYVGLHPVFVPRHPVVGKIELRIAGSASGPHAAGGGR